MPRIFFAQNQDTTKKGVSKMTISLAILTAIIILLMFGAGQKILDNLRLNDKQAIIVLILIAIGIAIPPIYIGDYFAFSIGGYLIPLGLCIYMLISCGWSRDLLRAFIGIILVAGVCYGLDWLLPSDTAEDIIVDNAFVYGIVAGIAAYALGRSRRNAFVCSILGISLSQIVQWIINFCLDTPTVLGLGVGGAFGTYVISVLIAVGLSEFFGRAFEGAKPDEEQKQFNYQTHTYDSEKNGKLIVANLKNSKTAEANNKLDYKKNNQNQDLNNSNTVKNNKNNDDKFQEKDASKHNYNHDKSPQKTMNKHNYDNDTQNKLKNKGMNNRSKNEKPKKQPVTKRTTDKHKENSKTNKIAKTVAILIAFFMASVCFVGLSPKNVAFAISETNSYYTVYDYTNTSEVVLIKGGEVEDGDLYLSSDNKLYQICKVDDTAKIAFAKYIRDEELPEYNVASVYKNEKTNIKQAKAKSKKYVGLYHTHNDESYYTPDGVDSVYGEGGIHDVGEKLNETFLKLGISTEYDTSLHLPHNSGAYTRSQVTAKALLDKGVDAIFDIHRDSTPRNEYLTTVNGTTMSKVRMVIGSSNQNYEENKNFAYSIKAYADKVYPNFIKDIYMGGGNYNQQLSGFAMLFEMGCENIEKEYVLNSCQPLAKTLDVVLYGSEEASQASLEDVDLTSGDGTATVISGLSNSGSGASLSSLWVLLGVLGISALVIALVCIFSKKARYKVSRFFSEMFAGMFGKKKIKS